MGCLGVLFGWLEGISYGNDPDSCALLANCFGAIIGALFEMGIDYLFPILAGVPAVNGCIEGIVGSAAGCFAEAYCKCKNKNNFDLQDPCLLLQCGVKAIIGCITGATIDGAWPSEGETAMGHMIFDFIEEAMEGAGLLDVSDCPFVG